MSDALMVYRWLKGLPVCVDGEIYIFPHGCAKIREEFRKLAGLK